MTPYDGELPKYFGGVGYVTRNLRYKADEVIDKSDLNRSTTEFCFDSGGIFEIRSVGRVMRNGATMSECKLEALVQVYDAWRESTQAQFVNGEISESDNPTNKDGASQTFAYSGKIVRDGKDHGGKRLALDTQPEALVPLNYSFKDGGRNADVVDKTARNGRNVWGIPKARGQPDTIANHVMPASFDGQIVLATNTTRFSEGGEERNTFLASFNGDLDTDTCVGNGREQAKSPGDRTTRVLDTCSILGVLNDTDERHVDYDMQDGSQGKYATFPFTSNANVIQNLKPLHANLYTDNVTMRQGDLRPEGVWLGYVGVSGNEGTIKYLMDLKDGGRKNFDPDNSATPNDGATVCMWAKPNWYGDDKREHEFFSANTNPGYGSDQATARGCRLVSQDHPNDPGPLGGLSFYFEDQVDADCEAGLYGGSVNRLDRSTNNPQFRQPSAGRLSAPKKHNNKVRLPERLTTRDTTRLERPFRTLPQARNHQILTTMNRVFTTMQKNPEGSTWNDVFMWSRLDTDGFKHCDLGTSGHNQRPLGVGPTAPPTVCLYSGQAI